MSELPLDARPKAGADAEDERMAASYGRDLLHAQLFAANLRLAAAADPGLIQEVLMYTAGIEGLRQELDRLKVEVASARAELQEVREMAAAVARDFDQLEITRDRLIYDVRRLRSQKARLEEKK